MKEFVKDFMSNYPLVSAISCWLLAQIIKVFTGMFKERKFNVITLLVSTGGMPSSHSAVVCGLATACIVQEGIASPLAAITLVLALIVMVDASGVRYESGKQAQILNKIMVELFSPENSPEMFNTRLKELIGHTPLQVYVGALVGIVCSLILAIFMVW